MTFDYQTVENIVTVSFSMCTAEMVVRAINAAYLWTLVQYPDAQACFVATAKNDFKLTSQNFF